MKSRLGDGLVILLDRSHLVDVLDAVHGLIKSARMRKLRRLSQIDPTVMFSGDDVDISRPDQVQIGPGCAFHTRTVLNTEGGLRIGRYVHCGYDLTVFTNDHEYTNADAIPFDSAKRRVGPVVIEDFAWIGANVCILPGVTIGEGAVVGMGSVVRTNVPRGAIVVGNPARTLGFRDLAAFDQLKALGKFY